MMDGDDRKVMLVTDGNDELVDLIGDGANTFLDDCVLRYNERK